MKSNRSGLVILGYLALGLAGCGGSLTITPLTVTLAPPSASITVNSSVQIVIQNPTDLPKYTSSIAWSVQEDGSGSNCFEYSNDPSNAPPMPNCPSGWLAGLQPQTGYSTGRVYYCAPSTATTAHVVATVKIYTDTSQSVVKSEGSATTTVTVTSQ
jgi:hypothetical protein